LRYESAADSYLLLVWWSEKLESGIVLISVATLALFFGAAALPRSLLVVAFLTVAATVAGVLFLEIAPTRSQDSSAVVLNQGKLLNPQ
jgi:hypothetical protein